MDLHISPERQAHLAELASSSGLSADRIVQEALALWEACRMPPESARAKHTPAEAAARIRALRKGNVLPEGETIKDLIDYGRA